MSYKPFIESEINLIHSIWKQTNKITFHTSKYVGRQFPTYRLFLNCVADYYGIEEDHAPDGTQGVFNTYREMESYATKELVGRSKCDVEIKCIDINPTFSIDSPSDMQIIYNKMGGINETQFIFTIDEEYREIPDGTQYNDFYPDQFHPEYDLEYHDDTCIIYVIRDVISLVEKRFGVRLGQIGSKSVSKEEIKTYER